MQEQEVVMDVTGASRTALAAPEWLPRLAHDLRSPLTPLRIAGQMLQISEIPLSELQELGKAIHRQTRLLEQLADDLEDVLKISRGLFRLNLQPCDLGTVTANAVAEVSRRSRDLGTASRAVTVRRSAGPIVVDADEDRLMRLVVQMIGAIAPTADGEDECWIECERLVDEAIVRIHDDSKRIYRSAGIEYLANGTFPEDPGIFAMSSVIGREIALGHSAVLDIGDAMDGPIAEIKLKIPLLEASPH